MRLAGKSYRIAGVVLHPERRPLNGSAMGDPSQNAHDIALVRLAEQVADVKPLGLHAQEPKPGQKIVFAGHGSWIPDGSVGMPLTEADEGKRGVLHAGTNRRFVGSLELQAGLAGRVGEPLDTTVELVTGAIETHGLDALGLGKFGQRRANDLGSVDVPAVTDLAA